MVQKKVTEANNKLGIQANTCKTEKQQAVIKSSLQNHSCKSKGADLKAIKMKKSRSIKRSNLDVSLQSSQQPRKPPPFVTPAQTPSPMKPLPCKSPYTSPNYMKSTTSSEARKEKTSKISNILSTSKLHRVAKTLTKTSTLEKMRTLTKPPSFKHTRSTGACKKAVLCQSNLDVQKATCSSTLKDSKFSTYLKLKPGATEAEGNSVFKVCPYSYCSLNGHHHVYAPPLKQFLSSRRKMMKSLKFRPEDCSPLATVTPLECNKANGESDQDNDLFVEVYVPDRKIATQVSESLSDEPCSEIEFQDNLDQVEVNYLSGMKNFGLADEGHMQTPIEKQTSFESLSLSLDDYFGEGSDMEWEEGQHTVTYNKCEMFVQTEYTKDQDRPKFEANNDDGGGYLEFLAEDYPSFSHDEVVECLCFSDTDSLTEGETTHTGDKHADDMNSKPSKEITEHFGFPHEATFNATKHDDESIGKHGETFSFIFEGNTEPRNEDLVSNQEIDETNNGDELNEKSYTAEGIREGEKEAAEVFMEEREPSEAISKRVSTITDHLETPSETETNHNVSENAADNFIQRRSTDSDNNGDSNKVSFHFNENNDAKVKASRMKDHHKIREAYDVPTTIGSNKQDARKCISNKMKRLSSSRKADEETEEEKEFNPREPNFLAGEPEPEAEKVDLRHQEMDERRNAEEWMLDHALQKTVNQLAPARKRKVALLVEAFESVLPLPVPKFESNRRRSPPRFAHLRTLQACS